MRYQDCLHSIRQLNEQFRHYKSIESLFELDQWSMLPAEGAAYRQQTAAFIGEQKNALYCGDEARRVADFRRASNPKSWTMTSTVHWFASSVHAIATPCIRRSSCCVNTI